MVLSDRSWSMFKNQVRLFRLTRPDGTNPRLVLRIPTLAIHLDRQETFSFNKETQLFPIAGLVEAELNNGSKKGKPQNNDEAGNFNPLKTATERHHPFLVELLASEASVKPEDVVDFEMLLFDTQKACLGGIKDEFIFSARLDNLGMSYCATMGLIESLSSPSALDNEESIRLIALFDHEEIGSETAQGADSNALPAILRRLAVLPAGNFVEGKQEDIATAYEQSLSSSFLVSADMAHSVNPNYAAKYESDHKPEMNKGTVIKINANARYATNSPGIVLVQESARLAKNNNNGTGVPLQLFVVRNDSSCGSTIGPMLSAALGVRTLDLGNAQLSMHSIRETGGTKDVLYGVRLFSSFFENYSTLQGKIFVD